MPDNRNLSELRAEIDQLDQELLEVLAKRLSVVKAVGALKKEQNIAPLDENRWQQVLESKIALAAKLGISAELVAKIYNAIHEEALQIESK